MAIIDYSGALNRGPVIGRVIGGAPSPDGAGIVEDTPARDILGPDTEAGQALLVAGIGFALLFIAVGPGGGIAAKLSRVLGALVLVASAMAVVGWATRSYSGLNPNAPGAKGIAFDF